MRKLYYSIQLYKGRNGRALYTEHKHNICPYKRYTKIGSEYCCNKCKYFIKENTVEKYVECNLKAITFKEMFTLSYMKRKLLLFSIIVIWFYIIYLSMKD